MDLMTLLIKTVLTLALLTWTTQGKATYPCYFWDNAIYIKGKCYKAFTHEWLDWKDAQSACGFQSSHGRLAEPLGTRDMNTVIQYISKLPVFQGWIGGKKEIGELMHVWSHNKTVVTVTGNIGTSEGCMYFRDNYVLSSDCNDLRNYVCEQEVGNPCDHQLPGAEFYMGQCFLIYPEQEKFVDAKSECYEMGAFLAEPMSPELMEFVKGLRKDTGNELWLGASADKNGKALKWSASGTTVDTSLYDSTNVFTFTPCMGLMDTGVLVEACTQYRRPLCQKDIGSPCELSAPGSMYSSGYCFKYFDTPATFGEAEAICMEMDGYLAEPQTGELEDFLVDYMIYKMKELKACDARGSSASWIGLTYFDVDKSTRWRTNGTLASWSTPWPAWHDKYMEEDHCAVATSMGDWVQRACNSTQVFVCQKQISFETKERYIVPLDLSTVDPRGDYGRQYSICVATTLTEATTHLTLTFYSDGVKRLMKMAFVDNANPAYQYQYSLYGVAYDVMEVKATYPVTVTLYVSSSKCYESMLIYPTIEDQYPWLYTETYYMVVPAIMDILNGDVFNELVIVPTQEGSTYVTIILPEALENYFKAKHIGTNGMVTQSLHQFNPYKLNGTMAFGGCQVTANKEVAVFFMEVKYYDSGSSMGLDQLPPLSLLSNEYVALPSVFGPKDAEEIDKLAYMRTGSTSNNSYVTIPFTMKEKYQNLDPAIVGDVYAKYLNATTALDLVVVQFTGVADLSSVFSASPAFVVQKGNISFYSVQSLTINETRFSQCTLSLIPEEFWGMRYVTRFPEGSDPKQPPPIQHVYLYLVVHNHTHDIHVNGKPRDFTCAPIEESPLFGCHGYLDAMDYDNTVTIEMVEKFGAYVMVISAIGQACHSMGVDMPQRKLYHGPIHIDINTVTLMPSRPPTTASTTQATTMTTATTATPTSSTATTTTTTTATSSALNSSPTNPNPTMTPCPTIYPMTHSTNDNHSPSSDRPTSVTGRRPLPHPTTKHTATTNNHNTAKPATTKTATKATTETTTENPPENSNSSQCASPTLAKTNLTTSETEELVEDIQRTLIIEGSNTTISKRKKISASDDRTSSTIIGSIGVCFFIAEVAVIVVPDMINICKIIWP